MGLSARDWVEVPEGSSSGHGRRAAVGRGWGLVGAVVAELGVGDLDEAHGVFI